MTRSVYVAAPEGHTGKSVIALGVLDTVDLGNEIVAILEVVPNRVEVATA